MAPYQSSGPWNNDGCSRRSDATATPRVFVLQQPRAPFDSTTLDSRSSISNQKVYDHEAGVRVCGCINVFSCAPTRLIVLSTRDAPFAACRFHYIYIRAGVGCGLAWRGKINEILDERFCISKIKQLIWYVIVYSFFIYLFIRKSHYGVESFKVICWFEWLLLSVIYFYFNNFSG